MHLEEPFTLRTLKTSAWTAIVAAVLFFLASHREWAAGFTVGAALSLFSLFSLVVLVPILFRPGAGRFAKGLLSLTLFCKLPFYMGALYFGTTLPGAQPAAMALGIALVPFVITMKTIGKALFDTEAAPDRTPAEAPTRSVRVATAEPIRERG